MCVCVCVCEKRERERERKRETAFVCVDYIRLFSGIKQYINLMCFMHEHYLTSSILHHANYKHARGVLCKCRVCISSHIHVQLLSLTYTHHVGQHCDKCNNMTLW